jgi:hypothetical protein
MPIRINLLAEARMAEDMRRRDPVKRTIYVGAFCVALALVWSSSLLLKEVLNKNSLSQVDAEIQIRTNEFSTVMVGLQKIADAQKKLDALQKLGQARLLQGNLLNALQQISVPNVQLIRLRVDQAYLESAPPRGSHPAPGSTTEKIVVTMDAKDSSANPGDGMNKFKEAVAKDTYFKSFLDSTNGLRLTNVSPPQSGVDNKPYVLFTLECHYLDHTR